MTRHHSPRFGDVFKIHDVPGRTDIEFHPGNLLKDTKGCPLPGLEREIRETVDGMEPRKVLYSGKAMELMKDKFGYEDIELTITEEY